MFNDLRLAFACSRGAARTLNGDTGDFIMSLRFSLMCIVIATLPSAMNAQPAKQPTRLVKLSGFIQHLQWSPDGKKFLFTRVNYGGKMGIWTVNIDGTELNQLLPKATMPQFDGHWAPDSKRIVFVY